MTSLVIWSRSRAFVTSLMALCVLLFSQAALAAGRVEWKSKDLQEREGGSWRLEVAIFLPRALQDTPDPLYIPTPH